jgi:hypothetical protein
LLAASPDLPLDQPHMDLCCLGRRFGYRSGLKSIETQLGISRSTELQGMCGADAGRLWNRWRHRRDAEARETLLAYNEADCVNLQPLADLFYCQMVQRCQADGLRSHDSPIIDLGSVDGIYARRSTAIGRPRCSLPTNPSPISREQV